MQKYRPAYQLTSGGVATFIKSSIKHTITPILSY